jgi:hypothetical protein
MGVHPWLPPNVGPFPVAATKKAALTDKSCAGYKASMLSFTAYVTPAMMVPMQVSISSSLIARLVMTSSLGRLLATSISRRGLRENLTATPLTLDSDMHSMERRLRPNRVS